MSEIADNTLCEKFEANVFAKRRCQNCFRAVGTHQSGNQIGPGHPDDHVLQSDSRIEELEGHIGNTSGCGNVTSKPSTGDQWDPLCILAPQCELYVCVGSEEKAERCQESLAYTQLSSTADKASEEESEEIVPYPDSCTGTSIDVDTDATPGGDWEMTRFLDSSLGPDRRNTMYHACKKQEGRPEKLHARWSETTTSKSFGKTEAWSCLKAESKVMSQDHGDKCRKPQAESCYFSLERRKSEPSCTSSPPHVGHGPLPVRGEASKVGGYPASSISSADSNPSGQISSRSEGPHGLMRQEYTVLADLPKPKRISHREAFEKERSSSRTRSPGRAEVERIFGHERRKSETLGAFQALEEGLLDRLDSKTLKLAKEGQLVKKKPNPALHREVSKRLPREPQQPSRSRRESLHAGRAEQRAKRSGGSPSGSSCSGSPTQRLDRENRSKGVSLHSVVPTQQVRGDRRKWEEPAHPPRAGRERTQKQMDNSRNSHLETMHQRTSSGKSTESKWKNCLGALHTVSPTQSLDKSQASQRGQVERYKESDRRARGKPLLFVDIGEQPRKDVRDCKEAVYALSPGREMAAPGKDGATLSPRRQAVNSWEAQRETRGAVSPGSSMGTSLKSHGEAGSRATPERSTRGSQRENRHSLSPERSMGTSFRSHGDAGRSISPQRYTGDNQKETRRSLSPERSMGTGFRSHGEAGRSISPQRYTGDSQKETRRSLSPERSMGTGFRSHGEAGRSISPQRYTGDSQKETRRSLSPERSMGISFRSCGEAGRSISPQRYTGDSQKETRRSLSPERSMGMSFRSHGDAGRSISPQRYTGDSQKENRRSLSPERSMGTSFRSHGEAGRSISPQRYTGDSQKETRRSLSPERSMGTGFRSHGEAGHSVSPQRHTGGSLRETESFLSPGRSSGTSPKSHGEVGSRVSPGRYTGGNQRESGRSYSPGRDTESRNISEEIRRSPSPRRPVESNCSCPKQLTCCGVHHHHLENSWESQKEVLARTPRISAGSDWADKGQKSDSWTPGKQNAWDSCGKPLCPTSLPIDEEVRTAQEEPPPPENPFWALENNWKSLEMPISQVHPTQCMENVQISSRKHPYSAKPGQQELEANGKTQASSTNETTWVNQEKCPSPMKPEKQVENQGIDEVKLHQPQLEGGPPLKTACSSQSQEPYLNTSQNHQIMQSTRENSAIMQPTRPAADPVKQKRSLCLRLSANSQGAR